MQSSNVQAEQRIQMQLLVRRGGDARERLDGTILMEILAARLSSLAQMVGRFTFAARPLLRWDVQSTAMCERISVREVWKAISMLNMH